MRNKLIVTIILASLLAGCQPAANPVDVQAQVNTAVAQTMEAQQQIEGFVAQTVAAQIPASTPTVEIIPTNTLLVIPTFTALVLPADTAIAVIPPSTGGGGGVSAQAEYSCTIISRRPFDNTEIQHGDKFDIKWTIVNTGTKTWDAGFDVSYSSGPKMATVNAVEIPKKMKPNDSYQIVLDAVAPSDKGSQIMIWVVQGQICFPYTSIIVK